jgi:hypothetical protein
MTLTVLLNLFFEQWPFCAVSQGSEQQLSFLFCSEMVFHMVVIFWNALLPSQMV